MKNLIILFLSLPLFSEAQTGLSLSKNGSKLVWVGSPIMGTGHEGTINFISGSLKPGDNRSFTGGEFLLDMTSISSTDLKSPNEAKDLNDHLKSPDFFAVEEFPKASFRIESVTPAINSYPAKDSYTVTGQLTIKGITHQISFPAVISETKKGLQAEAKFSIDRTKWNVNHQSKTVFAELKDGIISDEVRIAMVLLFAGC